MARKNGKSKETTRRGAKRRRRRMKGSRGWGGGGKIPRSRPSDNLNHFPLKLPLPLAVFRWGKQFALASVAVTYTLADPTDWQKKDSGSLRLSDEVNAGRKGQAGKQAEIFSLSLSLLSKPRNRIPSFLPLVVLETVWTHTATGFFQSRGDQVDRSVIYRLSFPPLSSTILLESGGYHAAHPHFEKWIVPSLRTPSLAFLGNIGAWKETEGSNCLTGCPLAPSCTLFCQW